MVYPLQKVTKIAITPFDFSMSLQAMTSEKLQFALPAVFTIGPADDVASLMKYAVLLTGDSDGQPQGANRASRTLGTYTDRRPSNGVRYALHNIVEVARCDI